MEKKERKKWIFWGVVVPALIRAVPYVVIPERRAWVVENPLTLLLCMVQAVVIFLPILLGAYFLLKWVRAGKKEEDKL